MQTVPKCRDLPYVLQESSQNMHIIFIHRRKILLFAACVVLGTLLLVDIQLREIASRVYRYVYPKTDIYCYKIKTNSLPDILDVKPKKGKSIFFHETSCNSHINGKISIGRFNRSILKIIRLFLLLAR